MIKHILFDLDGVLFHGSDLHRDCFLEACDFRINRTVHDTHLNGLSTKQKLQWLRENRHFDETVLDSIESRKKSLTEERLTTVPVELHAHIQTLCKKLTEEGYTLYCVSNSIRTTVETCLRHLALTPYIKGYLSNEDVPAAKPSPEPYREAFRRWNLDPRECLILEDSIYGRTAALASGAHLLPIVDVLDTTYEKISQFLQQNCTQPSSRITVVIPMAGRGSRFAVKGYTTPKPFLPVLDKPMIEWVIRNMIPKDTDIEISFVFIAQKEHIEKYSLEDLCRRLGIHFTIVPIEGITEGPACTVLCAREHIEKDVPLVTVNSDQYIEWNVDEFYRTLLNPTYAGVINTFYQPNSNDTKWSFARVGSNGHVVEVAEKRWISPYATTGVYGWRTGAEFLYAVETMIEKNERINGEFYICPAYSYVSPVRIFFCNTLWGLGVPEDLEVFLTQFSSENLPSLS